MRYDPLQLCMRTKLVVVAAEEQLRFRTVLQKLERVRAALGGYRSSERNDRGHVGVGTCDPSPHSGSEGEAREDDRQSEAALQPCQGTANIILLAAAFVVDPMAQPGAAEVEAEHVEAEGVQSLHGVENNFVVHGPAIKRVGMTNQC